MESVMYTLYSQPSTLASRNKNLVQYKETQRLIPHLLFLLYPVYSHFQSGNEDGFMLCTQLLESRGKSILRVILALCVI